MVRVLRLACALNGREVGVLSCASTAAIGFSYTADCCVGPCPAGLALPAPRTRHYTGMPADVIRQRIGAIDLL